MGVVFLDLEGLASINERFGHDEDNRALRALAEALKASIRESDVLARVGDDEFVVLVEDDAPAVEALAERVRRRIAADNARPARPFTLAASFGMVFLPAGEAATLEELIERAAQLGRGAAGSTGYARRRDIGLQRGARSAAGLGAARVRRARRGHAALPRPPHRQRRRDPRHHPARGR
jgi:diguanylate cyclase (GGDEF)-like protein